MATEILSTVAEVDFALIAFTLMDEARFQLLNAFSGKKVYYNAI